MATKPNPPQPTRATINQINAAHEAIIDSERGALRHAIAAGELLTSAKAAVGHGNWEDWLAENCHDVSPRTARLYMDLAKHDEEIEKAAEENGNTVADLSIRGARKLLAKPLTEEQKATRAASLAAKKAEAKKAEANKSAGSPDLPTLLKSVAADELATAIKQADWTVEEIRKLISALTIRTVQAPASGASVTSVTSPPPARPVVERRV